MTQTRSYHHGNLRDALVASAREIVERDGHQAVSLRELAQALEVSRAAPYRHFMDRDALLRAVAAQGFRELLALHVKATHRLTNRVQRAHASGRAFLDFTKAHPALFMLMFDSTISRPSEALVEPAAELKMTYDAIEKTLNEAWPGLREQRRKLALLTMWSMLYGFARLRADASLSSYMYQGLSDEQIEEAVIDAAFLPLSIVGV